MLRRVDVGIDDAHVMVPLGPSGSGKSTFLDNPRRPRIVREPRIWPNCSSFRRSGFREPVEPAVPGPTGFVSEANDSAGRMPKPARHGIRARGRNSRFLPPPSPGACALDNMRGRSHSARFIRAFGRAGRRRWLLPRIGSLRGAGFSERARFRRW